MALERLQAAADYLKKEKDEAKRQEAVAEVLSGKIPKAILSIIATPQTTKKRTHIGISSYIPKKIVKKCSKDWDMQSLVSKGLTNEVNTECWMKIMSCDKYEVFSAARKMSPSERELFLEKFDEAKCVYECVLCNEVDTCPAYVYCDICQNAYHTNCIGMAASQPC